MYDYLIVTHIPVFYKVNLYNELAKKLNIFVVFIAQNTDEKRAKDFVTLQNIDFDYKILSEGSFQNRDQYKNIKNLKNLLTFLEYKKLLLGGWDLAEFWYMLFINKKSKNSLALESTIVESNTQGIKGFIKRIFLSRISTVFASGSLHTALLDKLNYIDEVKVTRGVGIINKPEFQVLEKKYRRRFLYIGRLSKVKNLEYLIETFNQLQDFQLTLIGVGEDETYLKSKANKNIVFEGMINNQNLKNYFLKNDFLVLPSLSEPWGLVVEEALYFNMPVIVSENCGVKELIVNNINGFIFSPSDKEQLTTLLNGIDAVRYKTLLDGVTNFSIEQKDTEQVEVYL